MLCLILVLYLVSFVLPVISESAPHSEYGPNFSGTLGWQVFVSLAAVMWIPLFGLPALVWLDSTVLNNVAALGADIYDLGALTLNDSTVGVVGP